MIAADFALGKNRGRAPRAGPGAQLFRNTNPKKAKGHVMPNTQTDLRNLLVAVALLVTLPFVSRPISAQERAERSIEEIKVEAVKRAQTGMYPLIGLDPADVEEAFTSVKTRDQDEWATAFMR